jgi:hypothetical protein
MGKQIRFYFLPEDEQHFLDFISRYPAVKLLRISSNTPNFLIERNFLDIFPSTPQIYFWDSRFDLSNNFIHKKFRKEYNENQGIYTETDDFYYVIDRFDAPIIEYSRSFFREDKKLQQGRIWAEMYRPVSSKIAYKEQDFISLYEELAKWIRRNCELDKLHRVYVSRGAFEWRKNGGIFS